MQSKGGGQFMPECRESTFREQRTQESTPQQDHQYCTFVCRPISRVNTREIGQGLSQVLLR